MPNSNVSIVGNLTAAPELRFTTSGKAVANFSVAVSDGTRENPSTSFYDVVAWGSLGENLAGCLEKGQRVVVVGRMQQRSWEGPQGKRSKIELVAESAGPDLRWQEATVRSAPQQGSFPTNAELPTPEQHRANVQGARDALSDSGPGRGYNGEPF